MDFQRCLLNVAKALCEDEVKALAFLCTDLLGRNATLVESASDLFLRLADQDHLSAEQPHLLTELLLIIQRTRLIRDLELPNLSATTKSLISPYRKLLYNLSEGITVGDLKHVKFLLNNQLPRRKLEENFSTLEVFLEMEHMDLISDTNLDLLETIIQSVCPMLNDKINHFKALQLTHTSPGAQETGRPRSMSCPFKPNELPRPLDSKRTASFEIPEQELNSLAESTMNTSNTSMDLANGFNGDDECEALSHGLCSLNNEASSCASSEGHLRIDVLEIPAQENNKASSEQQTFQTANTNVEVLATYPMTSAKRGICLIINNYDFTKSQVLLNRGGTRWDEECLHRVFKWLGFEVEIQRDCKREKMLSVLQELGRRPIHSQMDCLVCCILSHGIEGAVYGVEGHAVKIKELMEPVNGWNCASLKEKPKLFFIQACQGKSEQRPVYIEPDGPVFSDAIQANVSIPSDADFLLGMATVPSFVSFRDRKNGSWFIQSLCQNLVQLVPRGFDLVSILTKVNADVSKKTEITGVRKQMPQPAFSLRKKVVFPIPQASPPSLSR
ncbi:caspase-8 isoform X2 [Etheostoma cragini]|uniref:caspase-8 isoform X2 n=1 Tax=Etheostoma cragini TaxID=417921 RepID=UPI00155E14F3|nr:caspase-8 isoform X2 [Etheostoma cragini]